MMHEVDSCIQCTKTFGLQLLAIVCTEREIYSTTKGIKLLSNVKKLSPVVQSSVPVQCSSPVVQSSE